MRDRELLEWAAKAYWGDEIDDVCSIRWLEEDQAIGYTHGDNQDHNGEDREFVWNPLTDDGDALRLVAKLRLVVHVWDDGDHVSVAKTLPGGDDPEDVDAWHATNSHACGGIEAATRLAIVRAAASIGEQKGE